LSEFVEKEWQPVLCGFSESVHDIPPQLES
jgi:hypothetical protein